MLSSSLNFKKSLYVCKRYAYKREWILWIDNVESISTDLDKIHTILFRTKTYEYTSYTLFFPYHNFIIPSIPFSDGVPIPCRTSLQFGSSYIWVFQTREVITWSLKILLLNHHAYSVDQYENLKNMKNTFHRIHLLHSKILFGIRLKKTSPFFINCSFKSSILSWSIFEHLVSFLIDRSSHQNCSGKKGVLKILQNSQENTCVRASFLIKLWILQNF